MPRALRLSHRCCYSDDAMSVQYTRTRTLHRTGTSRAKNTAAAACYMQLLCFFSLPSWCLNLWSGRSANMSHVIVYWCGEKQYSVIPRKCIISPLSLDSFPVRGTCRWPGGGQYDADILKMGGKLLLVASLLAIVS